MNPLASAVIERRLNELCWWYDRASDDPTREAIADRMRITLGLIGGIR